MDSLKRHDSGILALWATFGLLGLAFASYDLIVWFAGHAQTLLNLQVQDGYRFDEAYMYFAGVGKTILFDPYLKEHAADLTLRPVLPTAIFAAIYWLCGNNLDLAIFVGHVIPPLVSCYLIYQIAYRLTGKRNLAILAVLLAVGHFVFSALAVAAKLFGQPAGGVAGPDLFLLKQIFIHAGMLGNITAPNQFGRLFSPALTLPFLLLPIPFILSQTRPILRGFLIALNLYVYPHHIIVLGVMECVALLKKRELPSISFFIAGFLIALPYGLQLWLVHSGGSYADIYGRIGQTTDLSSMWFFMPFFALTSTAIYYQARSFNVDLIFNLGCLASVVVIYLLDTFFKFPQVHLVGLRIFAFLAPIAFVLTLKHVQLPRLKYVNSVLVTLIIFGYAYPGWVHCNDYVHLSDYQTTISTENRAQDNNQAIYQELSSIPPGSVVMTDVQRDIPYISSATDLYSYLAYGIVSSASNAELIKRMAIVAKIYQWDKSRLHGGDWDGLMSTHHWIFHHGSSSPQAQNAAIDQAAEEISKANACELLKIYQVDYIRFRENPPANLETCTKAFSKHLLQVVHSPS